MTPALMVLVGIFLLYLVVTGKAGKIAAALIG